MIKHAIVAGLVAAFFALSTPAISNAEIPHRAIVTAENTSVYITANLHYDEVDLEGNVDSTDLFDRPICSGTVLASKGTDEFILTAKHCTVDEANDGDVIRIQPSQVHFFDGDVGNIQFVYQDDILDVALLKTHSMRHHPALTFATKALRIGQPLFVFGMPSGKFWSYSSATSMNGSAELTLTDTPGFRNMEQIECASCYKGNSGGAIFNAKGQVVGIMNVMTPNSFLITPTSHIIKMLEDILSN